MQSDEGLLQGHRDTDYCSGCERYDAPHERYGCRGPIDFHRVGEDPMKKVPRPANQRLGSYDGCGWDSVCLIDTIH